jgi:hypothetical protein
LGLVDEKKKGGVRTPPVGLLLTALEILIRRHELDLGLDLIECKGAVLGAGKRSVASKHDALAGIGILGIAFETEQLNGLAEQTFLVKPYLMLAVVGNGSLNKTALDVGIQVFEEILFAHFYLGD